MTGLEAFDGLKSVTKGLPLRTEFSVHPIDALDLYKLTTVDLKARGYDDASAEQVSTNLLNGSLDQFGESIGLKLRIEESAPHLIASNHDTR